MQIDPPEIPDWTSENIKGITSGAGHAAELQQELDTASSRSRGSHQLIAINQDASTSPQRAEDRYALNLHPKTSANFARNRRSESVYSSEDGDSVMSSLESDDDDNYDLDIPPHVIDDAADLSQYINPPPKSEDSLAREQRLVQQDNVGDRTTPSVTAPSTPGLPSHHARKSTSIPPPSFYEASLRQCLDPSGIPLAPQQGNVSNAGEAESLIKEETISQPTLLPQSSDGWADTRRPRVSDKEDLKAAEIPIVAHRLIQRDSVLYFLENCRLIYETWMPVINQKALVDTKTIEQSVIVAFDTIQDLTKGSQTRRLFLRFAYMNLVSVINTYKATASKDRLLGQVSRRVGQRDASVAIDMYLNAKRTRPREAISRSQLLAYSRKGKRWSLLAGSSPILVFVFSRVAETIVHNNSIKDSTVQELAAQLRYNHPDLAATLEGVANNAGLTPASIMPNIS